jgi:acyl carrier protein
MTNSQPWIRESLQDVFRQVFGEPNLVITDDMTAADVANWDSLSHVRMIVSVEKHFKVRFKNMEIARLKCVGDLIKLIGVYRSDYQEQGPASISRTEKKERGLS